MAVVPRQATSCGTGFELVIVDADPLRVTIRASGELGPGSKDSIVNLLGRQRSDGRVVVHLDLAAVTFMNCSFLRVLVEERQLLLAVQGLLVVTDARPRIAQLLKVTGLDQILFIASSASEADAFETAVRRQPRPVANSGREPVAMSFNALIAIATAHGSSPAQHASLVPTQRTAPPVPRPGFHPTLVGPHLLAAHEAADIAVLHPLASDELGGDDSPEIAQTSRLSLKSSADMLSAARLLSGFFAILTVLHLSSWEEES